MRSRVAALGAALVVATAGCASSAPLVDVDPSAAAGSPTCAGTSLAVGAADAWPPAITATQSDGVIVARKEHPFYDEPASLVLVDPQQGDVAEFVTLRGVLGSFAVSPDGVLIAIAQPSATEPDGDPREVHLVGSDGTGLRHVYTATGLVTALSWSPDSRHIALIADQRLLVLDVIDESISAIAEAPSPSIARLYHESAWSPAGDRIMYTAGLYSSIRRAAPDERGSRPFATARWFAWSPDGSAVAVADLDGIAIASPDGDNVRQLIAGLPGALSWRPDGRAIAFSAGEGPQTALCLVDDEGSLRRLAACVESGTATGPAWSPDGTNIAILEAVDVTLCNKGSDVRLSKLSIANGQITALSTDLLLNPVWAVTP